LDVALPGERSPVKVGGIQEATLRSALLSVSNSTRTWCFLWKVHAPFLQVKVRRVAWKSSTRTPAFVWNRLRTSKDGKNSNS